MFRSFFYPNLVVHLTSLIHIFTEFGPWSLFSEMDILKFEGETRACSRSEESIRVARVQGLCSLFEILNSRIKTRKNAQENEPPFSFINY